ncbi:hypothetical protein CQW23_23627 [Capsicum baccatum]|uniref:WIYLD domain-containing protein n=1 Tax=Capsicum baccatum TaxID=33114 RepID=A0A2G2VSG8_CAPBA|nr:hypothetical protein CQW23_23627 [Capsicum baccatum]
MARRGRPRKRLSRMDAATDAMTAFGFDKRLVQNTVKQLLKEYGGDDGWAFIEEYGYKELIEAILRDQQTNDEQKVQYSVTFHEDSFGQNVLLIILVLFCKLYESDSPSSHAIWSRVLTSQELPYSKDEGGGNENVALDVWTY